MKKTVIRDADGTVINIGPWDYCLTPRCIEGEHGETIELDELEVTNPLPDGATEAIEDVVETADGGLAVASDYRRLRALAYPPIKDQLDAFWKGGEAADAMRETVLAVKAAYPKI